RRRRPGELPSRLRGARLPRRHPRQGGQDEAARPDPRVEGDAAVVSRGLDRRQRLGARHPRPLPGAPRRGRPRRAARLRDGRPRLRHAQDGQALRHVAAALRGVAALARPPETGRLRQVAPARPKRSRYTPVAMGRRGLLWTCVSSALVLVLLLAEGLYRYSVRRQLSELVDQIVAGHPGWDRLCPEFTRFGNDWTMPEPSLTRDFFAWSTRKLGWSSELDVDGIP